MAWDITGLHIMEAFGLTFFFPLKTFFLLKTLLILLAMLFVFHLFYRIAVSYTAKCVTESLIK